MAQLNKGTIYSTGDQVTAANINALVDNATILPGAINEQLAAASLTTADSTLLSQPLGLRKATLGQILALSPTPDLSGYLKADGSVSMTTGQQLTLGSTSQIAPLNAVSLGHLQANYLPLSNTSTLRAWATFSGIFEDVDVNQGLSGVYSKAGNTITCTIGGGLTSHGLLPGHKIWLNFLSGNGSTELAYKGATYEVASATTSTFTITDTVIGTTTGGAWVIRKCPIGASAGIHSIIYAGQQATATTQRGNYLVNLTTAAANIYYAVNFTPSAYGLGTFSTTESAKHPVLDCHNIGATTFPIAQIQRSTLGFAINSGYVAATVNQDVGRYSSIHIA